MKRVTCVSLYVTSGIMFSGKWRWPWVRSGRRDVRASLLGVVGRDLRGRRGAGRRAGQWIGEVFLDGRAQLDRGDEVVVARAGDDREARFRELRVLAARLRYTAAEQCRELVDLL